MSDSNAPEFGIPPYAPERDDELAMQAHEDDMLQTSEEPIRADSDDDDTDASEYEQAVFGNVTEDLY